MARWIKRLILAIPPLFAVVISTVLVARAELAGMPIDDAYIFERYALNLSKGLGYSFNPGEVSFGVTSFLWTVLNSAFLKISGALSYQLTSQGVGILCFAIVIVLVEWWLIRDTASHYLATGAALLCALSPMMYMNAVSGMETMFFVAALLGFLFVYRFHGLSRPFSMGLFAGAVFLTRPEGLYAFVIVILIETWFAFRAGGGSRLRKLPFFALGFLIMSLPMVAYTRLNTPWWLPTTYYGKLSTAAGCDGGSILAVAIDGVAHMLKGHGRLVAPYFWVGGIGAGLAFLGLADALGYAIKSNEGEEQSKSIWATKLLFVMAVVAFAVLWGMAGLRWLKAFSVLAAFALFAVLLIWKLMSGGDETREPDVRKTSGYLALGGLLFLPVVYGLFFRAGPIFGGYYNRYIAILAPVVWIMAAAATPDFRGRYGIKFDALSLLALLYSIVFFFPAFSGNRKVYDAELVMNEILRDEAAVWIRENTPGDAVVMVGYTGLGVVGGRAERRVVDLGGLINPDIVEAYKGAPCDPAGRWRRTVAYMRSNDVSYFITVPGVEGDPHSNPEGQEGFHLEAIIDIRRNGLFFDQINIWRIEH